MRRELEQLLRSRFPLLYEDAEEGGDEPTPIFDPDLGDGWFSILQALSSVLVRHAKQAGLEHLQVERIAHLRGGMHSRVSGEDLFVRGVADAALRMSFALSMQSGRPGRLMMNDGGEWRTLAPGEQDGWKAVPWHEMLPRRAPVGAGRTIALKSIQERYGHLVTNDIRIPQGWADIAEVILTPFDVASYQAQWVLAWQCGKVGQLIVPCDEGCPSPYESGAIAFGVSMAALTDPKTGACGPVDDTGSPEWWRQVPGSNARLPAAWGSYDSKGDWSSWDDIFSGPVPCHPANTPLIQAHHFESGAIQLTIGQDAAQVMREMTRKLGKSGCAAMMAKFLKLRHIDDFGTDD